MEWHVYIKENWLLVNFILGAFWGFLRACNMGLTRYVWRWGVFEMDEASIIIKHDIEPDEWEVRFAVFLNFLLGLPKTLIFVTALASSLFMWAGVIAITSPAWILTWILMAIVWTAKKAWEAFGKRVKNKLVRK